MTSVANRTPHQVGGVTGVPAWVGDCVAAVFIIASAFVPFPGTEVHAASPWAVALVVAPALILPLRRRWPIPVLAACVVLYVVAVLAGTLWPGMVLALAIAMFGVGYRSRRRTTLIALIAAVVVVLPFNALPSLGDVLDPRVFAVGITLAFAAAAGDGARSHREYIAAITERAERAEQTRESEARRRVSEERLRIARDLHDTVAHQIAVISLNAGVASSAIDTRPTAAKEAVRTIRTAAQTVLGEIGDLLEVLRTDDDDSERTVSPQAGLERLDELVSRFADAGLAVTVRTEGDVRRVRAATSQIGYRVIQEGLTNAHKHGAESRAHVLVDVGDETLALVVTNPTRLLPSARGDAGEDAAGSGLGLVGLRERVGAVRGSIESGPVAGTWRLAATLPLSREGSA